MVSLTALAEPSKLRNSEQLYGRKMTPYPLFSRQWGIQQRTREEDEYEAINKDRKAQAG